MPALVQPLDRLVEGRLRDGEGEVVDAAGIGRRAVVVRRAVLVGEDRDQPPVARIEVEVALAFVVEVRLLEDERHPEHALPEVDRRLPVGTGQGDVVHALGLKLPHGHSGNLAPSAPSAVTSRPASSRLQSAPARACPRR